MSLLLLMFLLTVPCFCYSLPAFPGAEGYGSETPGGRGGQVIFVTNLNSSGPGSFSEAIKASGARIIVFKVGGVIEASPYASETSFVITNPYCTIAGQTAPGDGICLKGQALAVRTHDVIIRGMRCRPGDDVTGYPPPDTNGDGPDGLKASGDNANPDKVYNVIYDHCSVSWGVDENLSLWYAMHDITWQWCITSECLKCSGLHVENCPDCEVQCHSMGFIIGGCDTAGIKKVSIHHNLLAHNQYRNALIGANTEIEWINNVVYNWGPHATSTYIGGGVGPAYIDLIGNYYKPGPNTSNCNDNTALDRRGIGFESVYSGSKFYLQGNIGPGRPTDSGDEWSVATGVLSSCSSPVNTAYRSSTRLLSPTNVTINSAAEAYDLVRQHAGASFKRDSTDTRIISEVSNGTGNLIDNVSDVGGYPVYNGATPSVDTDNDGMPDSWETSHGLNPNDSLDGNSYAPSGYTWVEEYINSLIPMPFAVDTTAPVVETVDVINATSVVITYSEAVEKTSAETEINYSITPSISILSVSLGTDGRTTTITTSQLSTGITYTLTVNDIKDLASPPNTIAANTQETFSFIGTVFSPVEYFGDSTNFQPLTGTRWSVVNDNNDARYFLNTSDYNSQSGKRLGEYSIVKNRTYGDFTMTLDARTAEDLAVNQSADYAFVFGYVDENNYCYMMMNGYPGNTQLFKVVSSSREAIATATVVGIPDTAYHAAELVRIGNTIAVKLDSSEILDVSDAGLGAIGSIGIGSFNDSVYFDNIDVTVSGVSPVINVLSPNGGESWQANSQQTVTWTSQGNVGNINISLSTDGGSVWTTLISATSNDGSESITVPNSPSTSCKIKVQDVSGSPGDTSNMNFTIEASPDPESISLDKTELDFGEVEIGNTETLNFIITNTGGGLLTGSISTDKKWIEIQPTSFEGNNIIVNVTVDNFILSQAEGEYTGTISITSNGGNRDITVTLTATCVLVKPNPYDPAEGILKFFGDGIVPGETKIRIYTLSGELVKTIDNIQSEICNLKLDVVPGIYIYTYESTRERGVAKFTCVR